MRETKKKKFCFVLQKWRCSFLLKPKKRTKRIFTNWLVICVGSLLCRCENVGKTCLLWSKIRRIHMFMTFLHAHCAYGVAFLFSFLRHSLSVLSKELMNPWALGGIFQENTPVSNHMKYPNRVLFPFSVLLFVQFLVVFFFIFIRLLFLYVVLYNKTHFLLLFWKQHFVHFE